MLSQAAGLDTTAEIYHVAVVKKPEFVKPKASIDTLIIDGLQDPGNIGTLMRSAKAFGFEQMILIEPCCDPYNEKVIRSSQGACVYLNLWKTNLGSVENLLEEESITPWVAHSKNEHSVDLESFVKEAKKGPIWLVIGSEGKGPRPELLKRGKNLHLPMQECVESLNAAVAGSILASYVFQAKLDKGSSL
jgi:TrmH family RNA methyltransferase